MRPVQQCTWNWRENTVPSPDSYAGKAPLLRQAVIQALVMSAVAALLWVVLDHRLAAWIVLGLALLVLTLGIFLPGAYARVHAFGQALGRVVGKILLYVLMVPFFYLFMTPAALYLRLIKRDPLQRSFRDPKWTYWIPRAARPRDDNIDHQFLRESKAARQVLRPVGTVGWQDQEETS